MTKQDLVEKGFAPIGTDNDKIELWARSTGDGDYIRYVFYYPDVDVVGEDRIVSYHNLIEPYSLLKEAFSQEIEIAPGSAWRKI